jgi:hypothetical protein
MSRRRPLPPFTRHERPALGWNEPRIRALLSAARVRESFRFTQNSGGFVGGFVIGLVFLNGRWTPRFDPLDKFGWTWHWLSSADRETRMTVLVDGRSREG